MVELGQDSSGLTEHLFSAIWDTAISYFVGERCCLPFMPAHRFSESSIYPILGRILIQWNSIDIFFPDKTADRSYFPLCMKHRVTMKGCCLTTYCCILQTPRDRCQKLRYKTFKKLTTRMISHPEQTDMFILDWCICFTEGIHFSDSWHSAITVTPLFLCTRIRQGIPDVHMNLF